MYRFVLKNVRKAHQYEELIKVFLKPENFMIIMDEPDENCASVKTPEQAGPAGEGDTEILLEYSGDGDQLKRTIFERLSADTGFRPPWGIMTGIRPVKLFGETVSSAGEEKACDIFRDQYLVSPEKLQLTRNMYSYQMKTAGKCDRTGTGVYIGIPFCPTRCLYCSFTSNQVKGEEMDRYMDALIGEIDYVSDKMKETGLFAESVYIGGGTPTALDEKNLELLLETVKEKIISDRTREFTVEAGRPDTVTAEKMMIIRNSGCDRISINPQTMSDRTLELIGRKHTRADFLNAWETARKAGIFSINCDLIAGLPGENAGDFRETLDEILELEPENITVHTLAVKRSSRLVDIDRDYHYTHGDTAAEMLEYAYARLADEGYVPYYLYRQKHMAGAGENVGFCRPGYENIYNIRIMDEHQSILALGAGGISKRYWPEENRLERVANVSNYSVYIERIDEMIERKEKNFFWEVEKC